MRSHRFYTPIPLAVNISAELPEEATHHCAQVLRYKIDDPITLFNGDGYDYKAKISLISKRQCIVEVSTRNKNDNESPLSIHLYQGIAKGDKMDLIIQKAVELGVAEITPVFTERCNVKLDSKRLNKKVKHWEKVIVSACEQSCRSHLPKINEPITLSKIANFETNSIYLEPKSSKNIKEFNVDNAISLIIGPEGGFSENDLRHLENKNVTGVRIGPRVLRTETAGLSAISILQNLYGDI